MCEGGLYHAAAIAAREMLLKAGVRVDKALDPLVDADFVTIIARLARALRQAVAGHEAEALKKALDELNIDWKQISDEQRDRVITASRAAVASIAGAAALAAGKVLRPAVEQVITASRASARLRYSLDIRNALTAPDRETRDALLRFQSLYVKDEFGRRADALGARARSIVADGLLKGLGSDDITSQLRADLTLQQANRSASYWSLISTSFGNRARTSTQLTAFEEAGITVYKFVAVLDERTTDICRYLDGHTYSVKNALARQRAVEDLKDPEEIRERLPWVRRGTASTGEPYMYYERGGRRHAVAYINESAVGRLDARGSFTRGLSDAELEAAGLAVPPLHAYCRSTIVTDEEEA